MEQLKQLQPYMPFIVMAINGLIAGWLVSLLLGGGGLFRNLVVGIIGAFVGGLIAYLQVAALYWFILPLSAVAPAALYLLVAFASVAVKALFQKDRCTSKPA